jgi:hypothetical protein
VDDLRRHELRRPLWSAFAALVNQARAQGGDEPVGFINPLLYDIGKSARASQDFFDVADGSTNLFYPAVSGYDDATGWGTLNGANLLQDLAASAGSGGGSAPVISNVQVTARSLPAAGGSTSVSADVTSASSLSSVIVTVTPPAGSAFTVTLNRVQTSNTFIGSVTLPANSSSSIATYRLSVSATDTSGNTATVDAGTVTVAAKDLIPPFVTGAVVTPPTLPGAGGTVAISAIVADASGVDSVIATVLKPDGSKTTVTLNPGQNGTYSGTFVVPRNTTKAPQTYRVSLKATDIFGNNITASAGTITVALGDTKPPTIVSHTIKPATVPIPGGMVTISAVVTDNVGVSEVTAIVTKPDGTVANVPMPRISGNTFTGAFAAVANPTSANQVHQVSIRAVDTSTNTTTVKAGSFTVLADKTRPVLSHASIAPRTLPSDGGTVTISVTATDNVAVASVVATIVQPNKTKVTVTLQRGQGNSYSAPFTAPANTTTKTQTYSVTLVATDTVGLKSATASAGSFTVQHP